MTDTDPTDTDPTRRAPSTVSDIRTDPSGITFGTLHPDGRMTDRRVIRHADIGACPHVILDPAHYRADGACRCGDPTHDMAAWGYVWDTRVSLWVAPPDD